MLLCNSIFRVVGIGIALCMAMMMPIATQGQTGFAGGGASDPANTKITLKLDKVDLRIALERLFDSVGVSYVLDDAVKGSVSASFKEIPFPVALETLLKQVETPLVSQVEKGIYFIKSNLVICRNLLVDSGYRVGKIHSSSLVYSATAIVQKLKYDLKYHNATEIAFVAYPNDNSILVSYPDSPEGEVLFRDFQQRVKLLDVPPTEIEIRVEVVLDTGKNRRTMLEMKGSTFSDKPLRLKSMVAGQPFLGSHIRVNAGSYELTLKPTLDGNTAVTLECEGMLDITYTPSDSSEPLHLRSEFTGGSNIPLGVTRSLTSLVLKPRSGKSSESDTALRIFVTPVWPNRPPQESIGGGINPGGDPATPPHK